MESLCALEAGLEERRETIVAMSGGGGEVEVQTKQRFWERILQMNNQRVQPG